MSAAAADVRRVLAPNPGPMTLTGTNTWILGDPDRVAPVVVDPGPTDDQADRPGHLDAVLAACGGRVSVVLVTHRHLDHTAGAAQLAARAGCEVRAADPVWRVGDRGLAEGDVIVAGPLALQVLATPGHTSDSVSLLLTGAGPARLLTGDTVLGAGTSVITHPDGDLADYLASLHRLADVVTVSGVVEILPGHGPTVTDPAGWLAFYRRHRLERLDQVRAALADGADGPAGVVDRVYPDLGGALRSAAEQSVRAQLEYLARTER